jgi:hypothetical protein
LAKQAPGLLQRDVGLSSGVTSCGRAVEEWRASRPQEVPAAGALGDEMASRLERSIGLLDDVLRDAPKMVARAHF